MQMGNYIEILSEYYYNPMQSEWKNTVPESDDSDDELDFYFYDAMDNVFMCSNDQKKYTNIR